MDKKLLLLFVLLLMISGCTKKSSNIENAELYIDVVENIKNTIHFGIETTGEGTGFTISASTVTITQTGSYYLSGKSNEGNIIINADGVVTLYLDNLNLSSSNGSVIDIIQATKTIIYLETNTENHLNTTNRKLTDAVIHSVANLVLSGNGRLYMQSIGDAAIHSEKHLSVGGGYYEINANKHGLYVSGINESVIMMQSGYMLVKANSNAIYSEGSMVIKDGTLLAIGGPNSYGIFARDPFQVVGGILLATGSNNSTPSASSTQSIIYAEMPRIITNGTQVTITNKSDDIYVSYTVMKTFSNLLYSNSKLVSNEQYFIYTDGRIFSEKTINGIYLAGIYEPGNLVTNIKPEDTFKSSRTE